MPQKLGSLAWSMISSQLYTKLINCFADLPNAALRQTGIFKALTGEDTISGQRKFKDPFDFENTAKLIFSFERSLDIFNCFLDRAKIEPNFNLASWVLNLVSPNNLS